MPSMIGGSDITNRVQVLGTLNAADFNQLFEGYTSATKIIREWMWKKEEGLAPVPILLSSATYLGHINVF